MDDRSYLRAGAFAAVAGAVLGAVGNVLHPRYGDIPDFRIYRKIADSGIWRTADLILVVAILLTAAGFVAIAHSVEGGGSDALARYGRLAAIVGGAVAVAELGIDTFALKVQAEVFAGAARQDVVGSFWATNAVDHLNTALFATWTIVYLGVAPLLLGVAIVRTRRYPTWIGGVGAVGGLTCVVVGFVNLMRTDQTATQVPFLVGSLLVTAWILVAGVLLARAPTHMRPT
jgi:uncharacterized protein DUF4386